MLSRWGALAGAQLVLTLLLSPDVSLAVQADYRIGVDDVLAISVWDNKDLDQEVFVRPDGKISLPLLGEIQAGGLTVAALAAHLSDLYGRTIKGAQVTVTVKEIRSRPVFFVGGIGKPGPLQLTQDLTLSQAISMVGGLTEDADPESAFVMRGDRLMPVDFSKLLKGDVSQNVKIEPGDTIVVPVADVVYLQGEVRAPGGIKFSKDLTMLQAIAKAGGFTPLAAPNRVMVLRGRGAKKANIRVNVSDSIKAPESAPDMPLEPNDIIIVPQRLF